jgi:enoyl-CoA hydratase
MPDGLSFVRVDRDGQVGVVTIDRPDARNALSTQVRDQLLQAVTELEASGCRCIVITGAGRVFVAGADVRELVDASPIDILNRDQFRWWTAIREVRIPIIAAVNGPALGGGCELALACDLVVAAESATFRQPEINLGIMPGGGATQCLPRVIGKAVAMDLLLTGRPITAVEARDMGLVSRVVPDGELLAAAVALAHEIAGKAPVAVRLIKDAVRAASEMPLSAGLLHERHDFCLLFATPEQAEGMQAFLDHRR